MIGVVADDLTGAAEIGAVGWRHGLRAEVVLSSEVEFGRADLVCIDTDSRSCAGDEAARRARDAAARLRRAGAKWIYKKADSVLRGQVVPEIEAIMLELGMNRALLAPANPSLGRTIQNGRYFVHGQPIDETEFARDPEHPRQSAQVLELLAPPKSVPIRVSRTDIEALAAGITVAEVASVDDLPRWAGRRTADVLAAGGAEFFGALLAATGLVVDKPKRSHDTPSGPEFFVCGSTSESSREFVRAARERGAPVFSLPPEVAEGAQFTSQMAAAIAPPVAAALRTNPRVILNVGLPLVRERRIASQLVSHLVQVAEAVLRQIEVGQVFVEGGATAAALLRRMSWNRLEIVRENSLGVVTLAARAKSPWVTMKPGSYAWPKDVRGD
jgi:uncharacterized protein YgbK (DUF1537 family)